jgi:hypothetical protein
MQSQFRHQATGLEHHSGADPIESSTQPIPNEGKKFERDCVYLLVSDVCTSFPDEAAVGKPEFGKKFEQRHCRVPVACFNIGTGPRRRAVVAPVHVAPVATAFETAPVLVSYPIVMMNSTTAPRGRSSSSPFPINTMSPTSVTPDGGRWSIGVAHKVLTRTDLRRQPPLRNSGGPANVDTTTKAPNSGCGPFGRAAGRRLVKRFRFCRNEDDVA